MTQGRAQDETQDETQDKMQQDKIQDKTREKIQDKTRQKIHEISTRQDTDTRKDSLRYCNILHEGKYSKTKGPNPSPKANPKP
jgi:hypothetical protein